MAQKSKGEELQVVSQNKKAFHEFEILRKIEAGVVLTGGEVKSTRAGGMNLRESYVRMQHGEAFLLNSHIQPFKFSTAGTEKEIRERKLLLHRDEIDKLDRESTQKGLSIVPTRAYFKGGKLKIELGIGRGKKLHDKREDVKRREANRSIARALKRA